MVGYYFKSKIKPGGCRAFVVKGSR